MERILSKLKRSDGQTLVMVALLMVVLMGFLALVADIGTLTVTKAELQTMADAAALAGAQELPDNTLNARAVAQDYITLNGKQGDTAVIAIAPDEKSISVTATRTAQLFFGRVLGTSFATASSSAAARVGIAASVPWIVPFVIPKPDNFSYDKVYVMRMYGKGSFLDFPKTQTNKTGHPNGYSYPSDYRNDPVYKNYPLTSPYPYQFDYMNVFIKKNTNFYDYINWLENGFHESFSVNQDMYYMAPSSGGKESVDAFAGRTSRDPNNDYEGAKLGDGRVMLIPVVNSMLKRNTSNKGDVAMKIIGFVGFFIEEVHKNNYSESFWFEGRFLRDLNVGSGEVTYDTDADFGLRVVQLTK